MYDYKSDVETFPLEELANIVDDEPIEDPEMTPYSLFDFDGEDISCGISLEESEKEINFIECSDSVLLFPFTFHLTYREGHYLTLSKRKGLARRVDSETNLGSLGESATVHQHNLGKIVKVSKFDDFENIGRFALKRFPRIDEELRTGKIERIEDEDMIHHGEPYQVYRPKMNWKEFQDKVCSEFYATAMEAALSVNNLGQEEISKLDEILSQLIK